MLDENEILHVFLSSIREMIFTLSLCIRQMKFVIALLYVPGYLYINHIKISLVFASH